MGEEWRFEGNLQQKNAHFQGLTPFTTKLGHKNWMFIGGKDTGWRSAVIYTFVEQVRSRGADPYAYFEWVFEKLMHQPTPSAEPLVELLPTTWLQQTRHNKRRFQHGSATIAVGFENTSFGEY